MNALFVPLHWLWACYAPAGVHCCYSAIGVLKHTNVCQNNLFFSISTISIMHEYMQILHSSIISIIQVSTTYNNKQ